MAITGVPMQPLPLPGERFDPARAEETNKAIEDAFHEMSEKLQQITELSEPNLAALIEGLSEEASPEDSDRIIVGNGDGTVSYVEFGDIGGGGGGGKIPAPDGRHAWVNQEGHAVHAGDTHVVTANRMYFLPFSVARSMPGATVGINYSNSTAGQVGIGVYAGDGNGLPGALLASAVSTSTGSSFRSVTVDLEAGALYYFAYIRDPLAAAGGLTLTESMVAADLNYTFGRTTRAYASAKDTSAYVSIATGTWSDLPDPFSGAVTYGTDEQPAIWVTGA